MIKLLLMLIVTLHTLSKVTVPLSVCKASCYSEMGMSEPSGYITTAAESQNSTAVSSAETREVPS